MKQPFSLVQAGSSISSSNSLIAFGGSVVVGGRRARPSLGGRNVDGILAGL